MSETVRENPSAKAIDLCEEVHTIDLHKLKLDVHSLGYMRGKRAIVILPGLDDSVFFYRHAFELIARHNPEWSVLGIDLRGQGHTRDAEGNIASDKVTLEEQCLILRAILQQYALKEVFLVALSYGAGVALKYASLHSGEIAGLGLIAPYVTNFKAYRPGPTGLYYSLISLNPMAKPLSRYGLPSYFLSAKLKGRLNQDSNWTPARMRALTKLTLGILDLDTDKSLDQLSDLPIGVHLLTACEDRVVPIAAHRHFYNRIPKNIEKSFSLEDGIGHRVLQDHPRQAAYWVGRILTDWSVKKLSKI